MIRVIRRLNAQVPRINILLITSWRRRHFIVELDGVVQDLEVARALGTPEEVEWHRFLMACYSSRLLAAADCYRDPCQLVVVFISLDLLGGGCDCRNGESRLSECLRSLLDLGGVEGLFEERELVVISVIRIILRSDPWGNTLNLSYRCHRALLSLGNFFFI